MSKMFDDLRRAESERGDEKSSQESAQEVADRPVGTPRVADKDLVASGFLQELGALRNSLESIFAGYDKRSILFTSAIPGEGVTTIATSFARFLAMHEVGNVLLCEMNARRPTFADAFAINGAGVTDYFVTRHALESIVQKPDGLELDVLHVGGQDPSIIQIHLNQLMPKMLEEALGRYETMIIDAPSIISCPETAPMGGLVDGVVLVVEAGKTKREVVIRAMEALSKFNGNVVGVVLNRKKFYIPGFLYKRI